MMLLVASLGVLAALQLGSAAYLHRRCRRREPFLRHLCRRSSLLAPYNAFVYAFSAIPNRPRLDPAAFPQLAPLQAAWRTLRDEAVALVAAGHVGRPAWTNDPAIEDFYALGWSRFYLKWHGAFLPSAQRLCPGTVDLLAGIEGLRGAMFALLPAGARLAAHTDPFAGSLRYHLGLRTPGSPDCRIDVDGTPLVWRDGEVLMFDETYLHEAHNDTEQDRLILFCDIERPMTRRWALVLSRGVRRLLMAATAIQNTDDDPVGLAGRAVGVLAGGVRWLRGRRPAARV